MRKKEYNQIKKEGATFTPSYLCDFLAKKIISYIHLDNSLLKVQDPSCGDGALLLAMASALTSKKADFETIGYDTNIEYIHQANKVLHESFPNNKALIVEKDYIEEKIDSKQSLESLSDIIIANPPYVRTQILGEEKAQAIANLYNLKGRVDLYYPFLMNMTYSLKEGGIIGVITSNRYLTTKSGASIRKFLLENYEVLEIIDLGDTKLFDAAVLPSIFIGRKNSQKPHTKKAKFIKVYETMDEAIFNSKSLFDVLNSSQSGIYAINGKNYHLTCGFFQEPQEEGSIWQMNTKEEMEWIEHINSKTHCYIGDLFRVKVGVKSCADNVFFQSDWTLEDKPEPAIFRRIISQEDLSKWSINNNLKEVIYPHTFVNGKKEVIDIEELPKAKAFFNNHSEELKKRNYIIKSKRKWYEYWVPQNPKLWKNPKIVFADISSSPRFAIDNSGAIVNGNCYWIVAEKEEEIDALYLVAAIANSKLMEKYHDLCFNNKLYSGKRRYLSQYVEKYPIPNINNPISKKIIDLVKEMCSKTPLSPNEIESYSSQIDKYVDEIFS